MSCIYKKKEKILMFKFIEEFYYGNIDPQARSTKESKTVQKQMKAFDKCRASQTVYFDSKEQKEKFKDCFLNTEINTQFIVK